ncbi:MAG TPA: outer membrane beta-barrel protein [Acidobacteriaceae bacterium]|nr:outer membrane beta-barrel protein [Acidobacteriaceae bacterium]
MKHRSVLSIVALFAAIFTSSLPAISQDASSSAGGAQATPPPAAFTFKPTDGFFTRWGKAYLADWTGTAPTDPNAPTRRGAPAPISSPPFPSADWPIGGTQVIGAPDTQTYMLQQAIDKDPVKLSRTKIYGWISVGANGSTNNRGNAGKGIPANSPSAYDAFPNIVALDQAALYFERLADTTQTSHIDWGYRLTFLYGQDYRYTTAKGMFSQQLLLKNAQYGFDPVMFYTDIYFPKLGKGADLRIGRYISLPDIEAQLAPNNYTYSHSILYTYDCYTQTGANLTVKVNDHWTVQGGLSPGCDTMPWTTDAKLTGNTCVIFTWHGGGDALNTCDNTINDGKYAYNNLTAFYETWYHKINDHWHTDTEGWYQYMRDTPNMYWYNTGVSPAKSTPWPEHNGNGSTLNFGAVCVDPRLPASQQPATCYAPEWAIVNYVEHDFHNHSASLNIRNEVVNDIKGQRTGTPGYYDEHMVGLDLWTGSTVTFRPELSYVHSSSPFGLHALDISPGASVAAISNLKPNETSAQAMGLLGAKTQALILAADLIWHF